MLSLKLGRKSYWFGLDYLVNVFVGEGTSRPLELLHCVELLDGCGVGFGVSTNVGLDTCPWVLGLLYILFVYKSNVLF